MGFINPKKSNTGGRAASTDATNPSSTGSGSDKTIAKKRQDAIQQTLAAWLNFAKGAVDWDEENSDCETGTASPSNKGVDDTNGSGSDSKPSNGGKKRP